jgi:hypothetical protein
VPDRYGTNMWLAAELATYLLDERRRNAENALPSKAGLAIVEQRRTARSGIVKIAMPATGLPHVTARHAVIRSSPHR